MLCREQLPLYLFLEHSHGTENLETTKDGEFERITINEIENDAMFLASTLLEKIVEIHGTNLNPNVERF